MTAALRWQDGRTPLHVAGHVGHLAVARTLLEAGADKEAKDKVRDSRVW